MNREEMLIQKCYFENFLDDEHRGSPITVLGEYFFQEQKKNQADLSEIRLAQGEIYFHAQDYEAAIFKWENIQNEWQPWARKNMADAYFELELHDTAEEIYQSIKTDSLLLNTEIALQLFGLYILQRNNAEAKQMILNAVLLNPDYPNVTKLARAFFEEQEDWANAVELAVNEAIRTKEKEWFHILQSYVESGHAYYEPTYFIPVLETASLVDVKSFDNLSYLLWKWFEKQDALFDWLSDFNTLVLSLNISQEHRLEKLSSVFQETYEILMGSSYPFHNVEKLMPTYLEAWLKLARAADAAFVYSAILTWNDHFPGNINQNIVDRAQATIGKTKYGINLTGTIQALVADVQKWARKNEIEFEEWDANPDNTEQWLAYGKNCIDFFIKQLEILKIDMSGLIEREKAICGRLHGSTNQLKDIEDEKADEIRQDFLAIEKDITEKMKTSIPQIIRKSADLIKEDTEFRTIHLDLNKEMNQRIDDYIQSTIMPIYASALKEWIESAKQKLEESQTHLKEWENGFNEYLEEQPIELQCDFQVIADWRRDAERMTIPMQIDNENIFLRRTPSQVLLKGAGKILGGLTKNNAVLAKSYRNFIENENYDEVSESIATKFFYQFQLFEKSIGRDVHLFFRDPLETLEGRVKEIETNIQENQLKLEKLENNPDFFLGPLKLFQLQLNQYKWLNDVDLHQPEFD
ncbi:tetratricopeptide repeat protein [Lederbergia galactosidilytica]|uniref:Tetratricopeptide repeat protein n=2 Tax=Lederbergia galactosidilytica TaxID=217031 RepID=A0A177ZS76_9BACI|nr:hypothetical protein [Lederbergia galactosidilytica]KRG12964.1 hypothetical protein ACA30_17360 [Virgibacillus soli]OAK70170.1 hypothetical protein ABB05_12480 [Lederbergia galactosidilytica]